MTFSETEIVTVGDAELSGSGVSWAAVIAGALVAVATSLILLLVGSGLGLTMVSPWSYGGVSATTFAVSSVIWLVVVQWLSSATGGYLAGRLRTRWTGVHPDEVMFRDTAHGFLSWALATLIVAALLTSAVTAIVGGTVSTVATVTAGATQGALQSAGAGASSAADPTAYFVDTLFRAPSSSSSGDQSAVSESGAATASQPPTTTSSGASPAAGSVGQGDVRAEATRILLQGLGAGEMSAADTAYLGELVARESGLSAADAQKRVTDVLAQVEAAKAKAKEAADKARKASATLALLMALALVVGAFVASVAAVLGGNQRDQPSASISVRRPVAEL